MGDPRSLRLCLSGLCAVWVVRNQRPFENLAGHQLSAGRGDHYFTYDGAGQLLTESRSGYSGSYSYDANGNRLTRTVGGVTETYAYDDADKLLSVSVGGVATKTYGYDAAGRTTSVVSSAGTTTLVYDYEGRATSISGPGISQTASYNGLDTRVQATTNSVSQTFLRNGAYVTDPVLRDSSAVYTPGISEKRGSTTRYLHSGLKNAVAQGSTSQTVSASRVYDAFGNVVSSTGTWQGPFGYAGGFGYQEDATGLKLLGHRLYDSSTGRFLTRDPIQDGRNWYVYCENKPLEQVDTAGTSGAAALLPWALVASAADGPLPVGDVVAVGILIVAGSIAVAELADRTLEARRRPRRDEFPEHTKKRPSTREKHQKGRKRIKRDRRGGEKGDDRRPYIIMPGEKDPDLGSPSRPEFH